MGGLSDAKVFAFSIAFLRFEVSSIFFAKLFTEFVAGVNAGIKMMKTPVRI